MTLFRARESITKSRLEKKKRNSTTARPDQTGPNSIAKRDSDYLSSTCGHNQYRLQHPSRGPPSGPTATTSKQLSATHHQTRQHRWTALTGDRAPPKPKATLQSRGPPSLASTIKTLARPLYRPLVPANQSPLSSTTLRP